MRPLPFAFALLVCACDGGSHLVGEVRDPGGNPIPEAAVTLAAVYSDKQVDSVIGATGTAGGFSVSMLHSPSGSQPLRLSVRKAGYRPYVFEFTAGRIPELPIRVVLIPDQARDGR
jgi:hypothetical protein